MSFFLGVDGGNTKTLAVVADDTGQTLGTGRAGNGDIYGAKSPEAAMEAVRDAITQAIASAGNPRIDFGGISIAGADWPEDYAYIEANLSRFCEKIRVVNDSYGALRAGTKDGVGVAVICGTYGTCGAVSEEGKRWQGGFWHRAQGGAVPLGNAVWDLVLDAELGIVPPTSLTQAVLGFYGETSVEEMLHRFTRRGADPRHGEGAFAGILFEAALAGDQGALSVVRAHGERQANYAIAAARHVGLLGSFPLVLAGGALRFQPNPMETVIVENFLEVFPSAIPTKIVLEPVLGALLYAYDLAGVRVDTPLETNLLEKGPGPEFYHSFGTGC